MAKKQAKQKQTAPEPKDQAGLSLKDMLGEAALARLKQVELEVKAEKEREAEAEAERRRREQAEKEKNKSFAELLAEYDKKTGGKYS